MRYAEIGKSGIKASLIGMGTWVTGGWMWGGTDEKEAMEAIKVSIDNGITLIDTAPAYGKGRSEEIVGEAIKGKRDDLVIATKCGIEWHDVTKGTSFLTYSDGSQFNRYLGKDSIIYETEQSLKRLGTDYIDVMQTHWQDDTTSVEETMGALMKLKEQGKIRAIGVSNAGLYHLQEYSKFGQLDCDQEKYSMIDREHEKDLFSWCKKNKVSILSYGSISMGLLSGNMDPARKFDGDDSRISKERFTPENIRRTNELIGKYLKPVADKHEAAIGHIAIAWLLMQPGVFALVGSRRTNDAIENAKAADLILDEEDMNAVSIFIEEYEKEVKN
ncbi:MAG: aldo/keto reductase [Candidatus Humimicrobiaceae bacterium]